jgi:nucleotide-binding universal stress UspA family protein
MFFSDQNQFYSLFKKVNMKRILVPIDFSPSSGNALKYAVELGKYLETKLTILHCFPEESFNRKYDFGNKSYEKGIKKKLFDFFENYCKRGVEEIIIMAKVGGVVENVIAESNNSSLVVLSGNVTNTAFNRFLGKRSSMISSESKCPVLLIPPNVNYLKWEKIWHIKRHGNERSVIIPHLQKLKISSSLVEEKTFEQKKFISSFWNLMVNNWANQKADSAFETLIQEAKSHERIDLFILVSHQNSVFNKFLNDAAKHALFKNGIPALVIQNSVS